MGSSVDLTEDDSCPADQSTLVSGIIKISPNAYTIADGSVLCKNYDFPEDIDLGIFERCREQGNGI